MMKRILPIYILLFVCQLLMAQASFTWSVRPDGADHLLLIFSGTYSEGWHLNEQSIHFDETNGVKPEGSFTDGRQRLRIVSRPCTIRGYMEYMICTDEQCLAPQYVEFQWTSSDAESSKEKVSDNSVTDDAMPKSEAKEAAPVLPLDSITTPMQFSKTAVDATDSLQTAIAPTMPTATDGSQETSLPMLFLLSFIAGLLALLTPCVWPVIPLTMSYFLKQGNGLRRPLLFGLSIVLIFLSLGIVMTLISGAGAMNQLATSAVFNVVCFILLLLLGLSFTGLFSLTLPASWSTRLDNEASSRQGILGIFLMALTLVVVSFSCTAPIVGALLVETSTGSLYAPVTGMLGFSLALALPFTVFALFPQWMKRMPRSGEWMTHVKFLLGILEIAFSLKFLSVADMAYGWHLLSWRMFLIIWATLFAILTIYIIYHHRSLRWFSLTAILPLAFTIYLISGALGGDTRLISAFMPPRTDIADESSIYYDYYEGMKAAKAAKRPVFIDFTGYGCVNCRKMEAAVFTDLRVKEAMANYIIIRLYVDDRTPLAQRITLPDGRILRTIGDRWALLEQQLYSQQTQPLYALQSPDGKPLLHETYSYDEDAEQFLGWLSKGTEYFHKSATGR